MSTNSNIQSPAGICGAGVVAPGSPAAPPTRVRTRTISVTISSSQVQYRWGVRGALRHFAMSTEHEPHKTNATNNTETRLYLDFPMK